MVHIMYSQMAFVCGLVISIFLLRVTSRSMDVKVDKSFLSLLYSTLFFCLWDTIYGYFASTKVSVGIWPLILFTYGCFAFAALTAFKWFKFTINYFQEDGVNIEYFKSIGFAGMLAQWAILATNFVYPNVFKIDDNLAYTAGELRTVILLLMGSNYLVAFVVSLGAYLRRKDKKLKKRAGTAVMFSTVPLVTQLFQLTSTTAPSCSIGFMLSCVAIYAYVISDEQEQLLIMSKARELEKEHGKNQKVDFQIVNKLASDVDYVGIIRGNSFIGNYRVEGLFAKYIDKTLTEIEFPDFDAVLIKLMSEKDHADFAKKASKDIVINRLKVDTHYTFIVNFANEDGEYQYRVEFFKHPNDINYVIMSFRNITEQLRELKEKEEAIMRASVDGLTGLLNKVSFEESVNDYLAKHGSKNTGFIFLDLDHFKEVNDGLGHAEGDLVLQEAADKLKKVVRKNDLVSRQGGDEFCIFIPAINEEKLTEKLEALHEILHDTRKGKNTEVSISGSIGCVFCTENAMEYASLRAKADEAMYNVKKAGRDNYKLVVF